MAKRYIRNECDTLYDNKHKCDRAFFLCTATPPCFKDRSKCCATCNRWYLSEKCFQNHLNIEVNGNLVCHWRQIWRNCSFTVTGSWKHECFKRFYNYCNKKEPSGHFSAWLHWNPAIFQNGLCMFSLIRSAHRTLKSTAFFWAYSMPHVLNRCDSNVKRWMTIVSIVNSVVSDPKCFWRKTL